MELYLHVRCRLQSIFLSRSSKPGVRSLNEPQSSGDGGEEEDCFSLSWESSADFCDDVQCGAHMEHNRDGGDNDCLV